MGELMGGSWYLLDGINAEPWTAPEASAGRRGGRTVVNFYKNEQLRSFQEAVTEYMERHYPDVQPRSGPIEVEFYLWRQQAAYIGENRKVNRNRVDSTNCQKALEDALQGILYANDREVVSIKTVMMEQGPDVYPRIMVGVHTARLPQWPTDKMRSMLKTVTAERHPSADQDRGVENPNDYF